MIPCPNCHQSIEIEDKHLGTLFTCPHCSAVYFIDWSGQPELATHESEQSFEPPQDEYSLSAAAEETPYDFSQPLDQASVEEPSVDHAANPMSSADFSDVMEFANSNANVGPLSYAVIIEGIESSHLLIQLKEAMTDSRFGWDVAALLEQVGGGRLVLSGLSPAKASVLVSRIKYLPLKISWRQDVLAST